ncbi:MAG: hypothetical protein ACM34I_09810 [bacterium]
MIRRSSMSLLCVSVLVTSLMLLQCAGTYQGACLFPEDVKPRSFSGEIKRLENIVQKHGDSSDRAEAYLQLSSLYASYKNPAPDYQRALKSLEACIALQPSFAKSAEIENWLAVLRELNRMYKEYNDMKDTVEKLQHLDIKMEEKRKQVQ